MPISLGTTTITALYLGTTSITSAYLGATQVFSGSTYSPASLFASGEQGVWYDPSDLTTLFQDTAGTTPVTAPGQAVALMLDKSGRGNNVTQATTASRPTYAIVPVGGRRNLLLATDTLATQSLIVTAVAHTLAFTGTGTVTLSGASTAGPLVGTGAGNRVSLTFTPTAANLTLTVSGSVTLGQLERASSATAYQKVTTRFDVTEAGVASLGYLSFDGISDFMQSTYTSEVAQPAMVLLAYSLNSASGQTSVFGGLSTSRRQQAGQGSTTTHSVYAGSSLNGVKSRPFGPQVARYTFNGASSSAVFNNVSLMSGDAGSFATDGLTIGAGFDGSAPGNISVYNLVHINRLLTTDEITNTEAYLAATSGVTL